VEVYLGFMEHLKSEKEKVRRQPITILATNIGDVSVEPEQIEDVKYGYDKVRSRAAGHWAK